MPKFPEPPAVLPVPSARELVTVGLDRLLWRVYFGAARHALGWNEMRCYGPTSSRFDPQRPPPGDSDRAVIYAATTAAAAIAEVFQQTGTVTTTSGAPYLVAFNLGRRITALDLSSPWPTRAGASQAINSGPRVRARRWALAIYDQLDVNGLWYPSSMHGPSRCLALWDSATDAMDSASPQLSVPLSERAIRPALQRLCAQIGYTVEPG